MEARLLRSRKAFAAVLAASRRDADLTQAQVAEEMGWTRNTVTKIEAATRAVAAEELLELGRLYKVEPLVLLGRVLRW
jgi:transcriptional regulator with XRE-family HTH domain